MSAASGGGTTFVSAATYTPAGALKTATYNGVINLSNTFNKRQQPQQILATSPSGTILNLSYEFGLNTANNGNVLQITNNVDNTLTKRFTYDKLNRLATAFTPFADTWGNTFEYDAWGNLNKMLALGTKPLGQNLDQTSDAKNRLVGFGYDAAGNMTQNGTATYLYDPENRLADAGGLTFTYDGDGKRVKKSNGTLYWTGMSSDTLAESNLTGTLTEEYVFFGGKRVARRDLPGNTVHFFFSDHLGSTNVVTNATGSLPPEERSDFYPFGGERVIVNNLADQDYKFTGKERDSETNLDYFGARYYAHQFGRFSSIDPILITRARLQNPQRLNLYGYALNNPIKNYDPDGRDVTTKLTGPDLDQMVKAVATEYRRPDFRQTFNNLEKSSIKHKLKKQDLSSQDKKASPEQKDGSLEQRTVLGANDPKLWRNEDGTIELRQNSIILDLDRLENRGSEKNESVRHEFKHAEDIESDPVTAAAAIQGDEEALKKLQKSADNFGENVPNPCGGSKPAKDCLSQEQAEAEVREALSPAPK